MDVEELIRTYPRLFHMAEAGAWPSIQKHGLLSTSHIVETSDLPASEQVELLTRRRATSTAIGHQLFGPVVIRDQAPLREDNLAKSLTDMTISEWLHTLNDRVFFWLHPDRLHRLLGARLYRKREHDVLTIDTRSLVEAHLERIRLSPINSGATIFPSRVTRGSTTFLPIDQYPFAERRKGRTIVTAVTELAVIGGSLTSPATSFARTVTSATRSPANSLPSSARSIRRIAGTRSAAHEVRGYLP